MASFPRLMATVITLIAVAAPVRNVEDGVLFSNLSRTLIVKARIRSQNVSAGVATVGEDTLAVEWSLDPSMPSNVDEEYADVELKLCFAPVSQIDRDWRRTFDDLDKDKTCFKEIATQRYTNAGNSVVWRVPKNIPGAYYFVRAYALSVMGVEVGYGQSTDDSRDSNLIKIIPITGTHAAMDIAGTVFSLLSVVSLFIVLARESRSAGSLKLPVKS
ncbi:hypothetical protein R1flu_016332 [Riccia fluitans]|uniref:High-affinity nitrate transporter n=1 Tax=Riccia fluitans TaxID=41844 RepID=A0ABD1YLK7_9MARC